MSKAQAGGDLGWLAGLPGRPGLGETHHVRCGHGESSESIDYLVRGDGVIALLAPRDPRQHAVNRSAANAGVIRAARSDGYRLEVTGRVLRPLSLSIDDVRRLPQHETTLPISCVAAFLISRTIRSEWFRRVGRI